jgi:hypothetical protein
MPNYQYQTFTEPTPIGPAAQNRVSVVYPDRIWAKVGLSLAILAGSYFAPAAMEAKQSDFASNLSLYGTRQFQFQTLAAPPTVPSAPPFTPTIDKYQPNYPDQFLKTRAQPTAIQSGSVFYTRYFPKIETVTLDKWRGQYPDLLRQRSIFPAPCQMASIRGEVPLGETVSLDKWAAVLPHIRFEKPGITRAILAGSSFRFAGPVTEIPRLEKWADSYPDYHYKKAVLIAAIQAGSHFWSPIEIEPIRPDKWLPIYPDRISNVVGIREYLQQSIAIQRDPTVETVSPDKWVSIFPDYIFRQINRQYPFLFWTPMTITPTVTVDMFQSRYPDLLLPPKRLIEALQAGSNFSGDISRPNPIIIYVWRRIA